jgi:hypothetical protein
MKEHRLEGRSLDLGVEGMGHVRHVLRPRREQAPARQYHFAQAIGFLLNDRHDGAWRHVEPGRARRYASMFPGVMSWADGNITTPSRLGYEVISAFFVSSSRFQSARSLNLKRLALWAA